METIEVIITVNSPGEVAGWLTSVAAALERCPWRGRVSVFVPPCTFASGSESPVARRLPGVDLVAGPAEFLRFVLLGRRPAGFAPSGRGVVLFLGGDLAHAALLARRLRYPAVAYTEGRAAWLSSFALFAQPYESMYRRLLARGVPAGKLRVVGNLMLDALRPGLRPDEVREMLGFGGRPLILLLPGSRPAHVEYMAPFLLASAALILDSAPEAAFVLCLSPFISDHHLREALAPPAARRFGRPGTYIPGRSTPEGTTDWQNPGLIRVEGGPDIPVLRGRQYDLMAAADLALTLPGTNTVELAGFGTPMIALLELGFPERIPLEGLPGLLGGIPGLGPLLKRRAIPRILARTPFLAWPNRLAGEAIVPEFRGRLDPAAVARTAAGLLADGGERERIRGRLHSAVGGPGASARLAELVHEAAAAHYGGL